MNLRKASLIIATLVLLFVMIGWLAGTFNDKITPGTLAQAPAEVAAALHTVTVRSSNRIEKVAGTVSAKQTTLISSRILAPIERIAVRAGDEVRAGDLLVALDQRALVARQRQAQEAAAAVQAQLDEVEEEYGRISTLFNQALASRADLDRVTARRLSLQADLKRALQVVTEAETGVSYSRIVAPISGRVIDRFLDEGDTVAPGQKILSLYDPGAMRIEANVREGLAIHLNVGDSIALHIDAIDLDVTGVLEELVPSADPAARTFLVKLSLPHGLSIYPGMYAEIYITAEPIQEVVIPASAVERTGQLSFVWIEDDGTKVRRFIRLGREVDDATVAVVAGLKAGDQIVVTP